MSDAKLDQILAIVQQIAKKQDEMQAEIRELQTTVANGFAGTQQLIAGVQTIASSVDEHQAHVDLFKDQMKLQEGTTLQLRKKLSELDRRVKALEEKN
ncbi:hypothetical protein [Laceyella putida]|uniref:Uncharacterized protein n=1 Tax=Laceyella putida TaxID=110101 RepID=A0ABW2RLX3_9BACL